MDTGLDLTPIANAAVGLVAALVMGVGGWALNALRVKFKLQQDNEMRGALDQALQNAVLFGASRLQTYAGEKFNLADVHIKNQIVQQGVAFAAQTVPAALKKFGVDDPKVVAALVEARLARMSGLLPNVEPSSLPPVTTPAADPAPAAAPKVEAPKVEPPKPAEPFPPVVLPAA